MLFRLAAVFNQYRFQRAAEDCWHLRLVTPDDAATYLAEIRRQGRTGVKTFEHWLEQTSLRTRPSQSGLELDVLEAVLPGRAPRAGAPVPARPAHRRGDPPRPRLAQRPARRRAGTHVVARRRHRASSATKPGRRACGEVGWHIVPCTETVRDDLAAFGLQVRITHDERIASLRAG